jgi:hypothetical protein
MNYGYRLDSRGIATRFPVGARNFTLLQSILFSGTVGREDGAWSWQLTCSVELKKIWKYSSISLYSNLSCTGTTFLRFRKKELTSDNYNRFTSERWTGDWLWYGNYHRIKSAASAVSMQIKENHVTFQPVIYRPTIVTGNYDAVLLNSNNPDV